MKLEWPIFTSTSPLLLFRPMEMRCFLIIYSKSLPSNLAIISPWGSGLHARRAGLAGADFRANNAHASLSEGFCNVDILKKQNRPKWLPSQSKTRLPCPCCLHQRPSHNATQTAWSHLLRPLGALCVTSTQILKRASQVSLLGRSLQSRKLR